MNDNDCVKLLQWALPQLGMQWPGFRKIRSRVCKRITRRICSLQLKTVSDYKQYLGNHPEEWQTLDELCRVTISRFYRDRMVFAFLEQEVLPALAAQALSRGEDELHIWSAGCASGEEAYTLSLLWSLCLHSRFPQMTMNILATDVDHKLLARAAQACYTYSSVKNLPLLWRNKAFEETDGKYCLNADYKRGVSFQYNDIRNDMPAGSFHLILCRNLAFTYFDQQLQSVTEERLLEKLKPAGILVIGIHEVLPDDDISGFEAWSQRLGVYRKVL
jgi:chemotaxis protein methyltransferase CheR